jgi:hypothetical protein
VLKAVVLVPLVKTIPAWVVVVNVDNPVAHVTGYHCSG